jgi:flagellar biosynthesis protein FliQ
MIALRDFLWLIIWASAPPLLAGLLAGLVAGFLQGMTQIQDQTISALPKLAALVVAVLWWGPTIFARLVIFAAAMWGAG